MLTLGVVAEGCGGGGSSPAGPSPAPSLKVVTGTVSGSTVLVDGRCRVTLAAAGGVATVQAGGRGFLVTRTAGDSFTALTSTCTHEQCTITGYAAPVFQCPCHGSQIQRRGCRGPRTGVGSAAAVCHVVFR